MAKRLLENGYAKNVENWLNLCYCNSTMKGSDDPYESIKGRFWDKNGTKTNSEQGRQRGNNGNIRKKRHLLTFFAKMERRQKAVGPAKNFLSSQFLCQTKQKKSPISTLFLSVLFLSSVNHLNQTDH
jgi:hypothetical protein